MSSEALDQTQQYLTFRLGAETFAVDVQQVREILDQTKVTRVPQMPDYMLGVINLRGSVVPVIDLRQKFGLSAAEISRDTCIVVLEIDYDGESTIVGAMADAVSEVLDLNPEDIEPPPRLGSRLKTEFIRGMGKKGEQFLILLDIDRIFSSEELSLLQDAVND